MPPRAVTKLVSFPPEQRSSQPVMLQRFVIALILCGLVIWLTGILLAPLLAGSAHPLARKFAALIYFFYEPVCHQMPMRSLEIFGFPMAVCARCFAFYLGGLVISVVCLFRGSASPWPLTFYAILGAPVLFDFLLEKLNFYHNLPWIRGITGLFLGIAVVRLLIFSIGTNENRRGEITNTRHGTIT